MRSTGVLRLYLTGLGAGTELSDATQKQCLELALTWHILFGRVVNVGELKGPSSVLLYSFQYYSWV
jgi:hypothetical protein